MATKTLTMFETRNDLPAESREQMVELLNARLADTFDLYSQLKQAHWSVKGPDFIQLHVLYDTVAESVLSSSTRSRSAPLRSAGSHGHRPHGGQVERLDEYPLDATSGPRPSRSSPTASPPTAQRSARRSTRRTRAGRHGHLGSLH